MTDPSTLCALSTAIAALGEDERRVLLVIAQRLVTGRERYGALNLAHDTRDWRREAGEEMADALVYLACLDLRVNDTIPIAADLDELETSAEVAALWPGDQ